METRLRRASHCPSFLNAQKKKNSASSEVFATQPKSALSCHTQALSQLSERSKKKKKDGNWPSSSQLLSHFSSRSVNDGHAIVQDFRSSTVTTYLSRTSPKNSRLWRKLSTHEETPAHALAYLGIGREHIEPSVCQNPSTLECHVMQERLHLK